MSLPLLLHDIDKYLTKYFQSPSLSPSALPLHSVVASERLKVGRHIFLHLVNLEEFMDDNF
jgi:hypothetical protein